MTLGRSCAVIGLGAMGAAVTARLLEQGWQVSVSDVDPERVGAAVAIGATEAPTSPPFVIVLVATAEQLESVLAGQTWPQGRSCSS